MLRVIVGLIFIIWGVSFIIKTEWYLNNFGRIGYFEQKLSTAGGSRLGYKLFGSVLVIVGILLTTNLFGNLIALLAKPFVRYQ